MEEVRSHLRMLPRKCERVWMPGRRSIDVMGEPFTAPFLLVAKSFGTLMKSGHAQLIEI